MRGMPPFLALEYPQLDRLPPAAHSPPSLFVILGRGQCRMDRGASASLMRSWPYCFLADLAVLARSAPKFKRLLSITTPLGTTTS